VSPLLRCVFRTVMPAGVLPLLRCPFAGRFFFQAVGVASFSESYRWALYILFPSLQSPSPRPLTRSYLASLLATGRAFLAVLCLVFFFFFLCVAFFFVSRLGCSRPAFCASKTFQVLHYDGLAPLFAVFCVVGSEQWLRNLPCIYFFFFGFFCGFFCSRFAPSVVV